MARPSERAELGARLSVAAFLIIATPLACAGSGGGGTEAGGEGGSSSGGASAGAGGSSTDGGSPARGGSATASGGASANGGIGDPAAGGKSPNGGSAGKSSGGDGTAFAGSAGKSAEGGAPASGGTSGGSAGASAGGASTGGVAAAGSAGSSGSPGAGGTSGALSFEPVEGVYSYPRTASTGPSQSFRLRNAGSVSASVDFALGGAIPGAFRVTSPSSLSKVSIAAGASLDIVVQMVPNGSGVPAAPAADGGGVTVNAELGATGAGSATLGLYGLLMTVAGMGSGGEATLGQALKTLGYTVDIGTALQGHLENSTTTAAQGSEVKLPRFVRAGAGSVTLRPVARFSPSGAMPYGYYTVAAPSCNNATSNTANCHVVGTMTTSGDANTSNGSRMLNPPTDAAGASGTFDPGSEPFGIWAYTDQASQKVSTGGTATNGDYCYTDDALNVPSSMHRARVWPLKDRAGSAVPNAYLIGFEEASNGDYQDYVFVISNVKAP